MCVDAFDLSLNIADFCCNSIEVNFLFRLKGINIARNVKIESVLFNLLHSGNMGVLIDIHTMLVGFDDLINVALTEDVLILSGFKVVGRINEEIQRELSALFRTLKDPRVQSGMVTITHVDTTSDLRYSRIYVSVLEKSLEKDVIRGLKSAAGYLRRELGANMSLRYTPELQFIADDSIEYGAHILEMLRDPRVVKPANPENETLNTEDEQE